MTKIFVTGATGTIGSEVARALLETGASIRLGVRNPDKVADWVAQGAEAVRFDYDDPKTLQSALEGVDRLFLLTPFVEHPLPLVEAALGAAKNAGVKFILRMSAAGADPSADLLLAQHHGKGEELTKSSGVAWSIIRPTFFMDNLLNYTGGSLDRDNAFYGASKTGKSAYISSRDVGRVAAQILTKPDAHTSKTYELTGPEALDDAAVAQLVSTALGRTISYVDLSPEQYREGAVSAGLPEWAADGMMGLEAVKANGWAEAVSPAVADIVGESGERFSDFLKRRIGS